MLQTEILYLALTLSALFAFVYGFINLIKVKKGYFYSFVVLGFAGFAMGRLFLLFLYIISPENTHYFNIGSLGIFSGFMCIAFAGNALEKADIIEIKNPRKYKRIALIMPALYLVYILVMQLANLTIEQMLLSYLYVISVVPCGYYCLRNIITPYPPKSLMRHMRPFFTLVLVFCILAMLSELTWLWVDNDNFIYFSGIIMTACACGCYIALPVFLERGYKKWIQM